MVLISFFFSYKAMIFTGVKNSILLRREYFFDFSCDFDLHLYPFDTQVCEMQLETRQESGFVLAIENTGVSYQGKQIGQRFRI